MREIVSSFFTLSNGSERRENVRNDESRFDCSTHHKHHIHDVLDGRGGVVVSGERPANLQRTYNNFSVTKIRHCDNRQCGKKFLLAQTATARNVNESRRGFFMRVYFELLTIDL